MFTETDSNDELRNNVRGGVGCHLDDDAALKIIVGMQAAT